jgi:hypothetical protein
MTRVEEFICEIAHPLWMSNVYGTTIEAGWCIKPEKMLKLKAYTFTLGEYSNCHNGEKDEPST